MVNQGYKDAEKGSILSLVVNGLLFLFKIFAGIVGHSNAMVADALDTFGDVVTSGGMLVGYKIAKAPPDCGHPYGHGKAESIIAKLLAIFIIALGVKVAYNSIHVMVFHKLYVPGKIALVAAVVSIVVKLALFRHTNLLGRKISSTAMTVYSWNLAMDAFSSLAALIGIAGARMGFPMMDPIAGLILSVFVVKTGISGFLRAYNELMDGAPSESVTEGIKRVACMNKNVRAINDIRVRKMGLDLMIDMIIEVDKDMSVARGHKITDDIKEDVLKKMPAVREILIHVEPHKKP